MTITMPNPNEMNIIEIAGMFILMYKLEIFYWLKRLTIKPLIPYLTGVPMDDPKSRRLWTRVSAWRIKPFSCYSCMCFWVSSYVAWNTLSDMKDMIVHVLITYLAAVLIQNQIER